MTSCDSGANTPHVRKVARPLVTWRRSGGARLCGAIIACLALLPQAVCALSIGEVRIERMAKNLKVPWGLGFLPDCGFLVTLRDGRLLHFDREGRRQTVTGVPIVHAAGQGGLLDIVIARDFSQTRELFLSFAKTQPGGAGTALAVARLAEAGDRLTDLRLLFEAQPHSGGGRHFGSRIVERDDGTLFLTIGDRGDRMSAQDTANHNGTIVRLNRDGGVPIGNPLTDAADGLPEIWSFGHRNPQGAALDASGTLWAVEHGAKGGDEVNRIAPGKNYGWPVIAYGRHYSGGKIGVGTAREGMEQPAHYWDPSIAPSGMMIYSGRLWPQWTGDMFVGSLKFDLISRLRHGDEGLREVEQIRFAQTGRVRDVREAPDGSIWFLSEDRRAAYRMLPIDGDAQYCPPGKP